MTARSAAAALGLALAIGLPPADAGPRLYDREIGDATVAVVVETGQDEGDAVVPSVRRQFESALQGVGANVLDPDAVRALQKDEVLLSKLRNEGVSALLEIKKKYQTDIVVLVDVRYELTPGLGNRWWLGVADVSASVYRHEDASQLGSSVAPPMGTIDNPSVAGDGRLAALQAALAHQVNGVLKQIGLPTAPVTEVALSVSSHLAWSDDVGVRVNAIALSAGGERLALLTAQAEGLVLLDGADGSTKRTWPVRSKKGGDVEFGPDGVLAAGTDRGEVFVCRDEASDCTALRGGKAKAIVGLAFSPDGRRLAAGAIDGSVRVWELADPGAPQYSLDVGGKLIALYYTLDGESIVTATVDGLIGFWDPARQGARKKAFGQKIESGKLTAAAMSGAGDAIALAIKEIVMNPYTTDDFEMRDDTEMIRVLSGRTGEEHRYFESHEKKATALDFGSRSRYLASAGLDDKVKIWDTASGREVATMNIGVRAREALDWVYLDFSAGAGHLAAATRSGNVRVWQLD